MSSQKSKLYSFPHICVVEASAGSGKTYTLARRYVELLLRSGFSGSGVPFKNILAITFSNKATMEMKARILELLKKIALDHFSRTGEKEDLIESLGMDFESAQKKARALLDALVLNYNFFQVQTIDSFVNAILCACALKLKLSAGFRIRTDASVYLATSLDRLIDEASNDPEVRRAFSRFLHQYLFLENRTGWFPKKNISEMMIDFFAKVNRTGRDFSFNLFDARELEKEKADILVKMRQLKEVWPSGAHKTFEKKYDELLQRYDKNFDFDDLSDYFAREEFPLTKTGVLSSRAARLWEDIRFQLARAAEKESLVLLDPYLDIFSRVLKHFRGLSSKEDVLFLDELNRQAHQLFEGQEMTVPELYYRLAMRLKHILIDEFQDTSPLQWENLHLMVEEVLSVDGSLFYVGDKKQAIYRFRGGEVALFDGVKEYFKSTPLVQERLSRNFRSSTEIVSFVNDVFSSNNLNAFFTRCRASQEEGDDFLADVEEAVLNVFKQSAQEAMPGQEAGFVRSFILEGENKEERVLKTRQAVLTLVKECHERHSYGALALLTRDNDDVELLTEWLAEEGIPVESEKTLNIRNNAFIKELISFLKFLDSPIDNLNFASFILGEIFLGASGLSKEEMHDFVFQVREKEKKEKTAYLYRDFRRRYPQAWETFFEVYFKNVGFVPLYELVISIYRTLGCVTRFPESLGFFMRFLELIKEEEVEHGSLALFLEFFDTSHHEELYVRAPVADAVKVLTIHKAKGLEFPVVIVPFLEMNVKVDAHVMRLENDRLVLRRLNKKYRKFSSICDALYRQEYLKSFIDELNAVYVALTRARQELYVILPKGTRKSSLASDLLGDNALAARGNVSGKQSAVGIRKEQSLRTLEPSTYVDWLSFLGSRMDVELPGSSVLKNRKRIYRGEVFHFILSQMGNLFGQREDDVLAAACEKARLKYPLIEDLNDYKTMLIKVIKDKRLIDYFFVKDAKVFQEQEVVDKYGHTKRIDRLIVSQSHVLIIDYKTSFEKSDKDREQVKEYVVLMKGVYPNKSVSGVLIYLDSLECERVT